MDTDTTVNIDHYTTDGTYTETERVRDTTQDIEDLEFDQTLLEMHTLPHTTHTTPTQTSPFAVQETLTHP